jgi:hypothetical protein
MSIKLPNVTLIALTGLHYQVTEHIEAINKSCEGIEFGAVKLICDANSTSIDEWNKKIIYELPRYISTTHALLVHADGYVINPSLWREEWLAYDYIGAPWPLPVDGFSYRDESGDIQRVGNSVSLRSKKLADLVSTREWRSYYGNTNEDGFICCHNRKWLEGQGCKFAPLDVAKHFSKEHEIPENVGLETFAFHSL